LTHPRLAPPSPDVPFFTASAPFTATGSFLVGSNVFDFVGKGIVTATWCVDPADFLCTNASPIVGYGFTVSVPEPPTLLLTVAALGALGALFSVRLLRDGRNRSPRART
jgi:hypothetical protein